LVLSEGQDIHAKYVKRPRRTKVLVVCPLGKEKPFAAIIPFSGLGEETKILERVTSNTSPPMAPSRSRLNLL
jgi:hypothetical protein